MPIASYGMLLIWKELWQVIARSAKKNYDSPHEKGTFATLICKTMEL